MRFQSLIEKTSCVERVTNRTRFYEILFGSIIERLRNENEDKAKT